MECKQFSTSSLVIITRRRKRYEFEMTDKEIKDCIQLLKVLNPELATGFPKGARIPLKSLPNTRDLGALIARDGRHILPHRLLRSSCLYHISLRMRIPCLTNIICQLLLIFVPEWKFCKNRTVFWREWSTMRFRSWTKRPRNHKIKMSSGDAAWI